MTEKTEALRLADLMDAMDYGDTRQAAAELRRLHAEVERLSLDSVHTCHAECQRPLCKLTRERDALRQIVQDFPPIEAELQEVSDRAHRLETQRDALLEALKRYVDHFGDPLKCARAVIKAVEEEA